jgi:hypothetical protein
MKITLIRAVHAEFDLKLSSCDNSAGSAQLLQLYICYTAENWEISRINNFAMKITLLVLAAFVVPGIWGAAAYWLLIRIRPSRPTATSTHGTSDATVYNDLLDYQI